MWQIGDRDSRSILPTVLQLNGSQRRFAYSFVICCPCQQDTGMESGDRGMYARKKTFLPVNLYIIYILRARLFVHGYVLTLDLEVCLEHR